MSTTLDIKNFVADLIGTGDGTTSVPKRDRLINAARRKFYSEKRWSFLKRTDTLSFSNQIADLPTDYNIKFDPISVYLYQSNLKIRFMRVDWDELSAYGTLEYAYAIDKDNRQIKISTSDASVSLDYTYLPADKAINTSDDSDEEPVDDITAIGLLATGMWYLGSRQSAGKYQLFKDEYKEELTRLMLNDPKPIRYFRRQVSRDDYGYRGR